jgi:hypothetical protein
MRSTLFVVHNSSDPRQTLATQFVARLSERPVDAFDPAPSAGAMQPPAGPDDPRSQAVRDDLLGRFERAAKMLVLIGENTHLEPWVAWQIKAFYELKDAQFRPNTWKCLRGFRLRGCDQAALPPALDGTSTRASKWDPETMEEWLDREIEV